MSPGVVLGRPGAPVLCYGYGVTLGSWGLRLEESRRIFRAINRSVDIVGVARGRLEIRDSVVFGEY